MKENKHLIPMLIVFFFISILPIGVLANDQEIYKEPINEAPKNLSQAEYMQGKYQHTIEKTMIDAFGSFERFEEFGVIYYVNEPEPKVVFGFKQNDVNIELFRNHLEEAIPEQFLIIKDVEYTAADLTTIMGEIEQDLSQYGVKEYGLSRDDENQRIELNIESISDDLEKELKEKYGSTLNIVFVQGFGDFLISRTQDLNNLGAGIGVRDLNNNVCSTAGTGFKYNPSVGKNYYYILTAGHCFKSINSLVYQYSQIVGRNHHSAFNAGYDFGLVRITDDNTLPYGRYATNDLFQYAENSSYYDAKINNWGHAVQNAIVRKSGITTNVTSGKVEASYYQFTTNEGTFYGARVKNSDGTTFAKDGDSGAIVYNWNSNSSEYWAYGLVSAKINGTSDIFISRMSDLIIYYSDSNNTFNLKTTNTPVKVTN